MPGPTPTAGAARIQIRNQRFICCSPCLSARALCLRAIRTQKCGATELAAPSVSAQFFLRWSFTPHSVFLGPHVCLLAPWSLLPAPCFLLRHVGRTRVSVPIAESGTYRSPSARSRCWLSFPHSRRPSSSRAMSMCTGRRLTGWQTKMVTLLPPAPDPIDAVTLPLNT